MNPNSLSFPLRSLKFPDAKRVGLFELDRIGSIARAGSASSFFSFLPATVFSFFVLRGCRNGDSSSSSSSSIFFVARPRSFLPLLQPLTVRLRLGATVVFASLWPRVSPRRAP
ncbi:hypothetical protein SDJN03_17403, partial [Cucurbita argyrosperma subsp. sororia]